jgi:glycosyltransferase involved in cell wall biosynthesis
VKILVAHNSYQRPGGEDAVCEAEIMLLREAGHEVIEYRRHNNEVPGYSFVEKASFGWSTLWSQRTNRELHKILARQSPDVAHFHNTFPLISPSAYYACRASGIPVVQTLHNYRVLCPSATLMRGGKVCEECLGRSVAWPGVIHACYRDSRATTAAVAAMAAVHQAMGTWRQKVKIYVALTEFARRKFVEGGLPSERMVVKPNFVVRDLGAKKNAGEYALYVGRLSEEKGPQVLLKGWSRLRVAIPLRIAGAGPLKEELGHEIAANNLNEVDLLGQVDSQVIATLFHRARFLVLPSLCYENFPRTVAEAFACGVPVISSRLGSMAEIVTDGKTGLHFSAGDDTDLAAKVEWAWTHPAQMQNMGREARAEYEAKYTAKRGLDNLMSVYRQALEGPS